MRIVIALGGPGLRHGGRLLAPGAGGGGHLRGRRGVSRPLMARKLKGRACNGLLIEAAACLVLAVVFKLDSIASIGSALALVIFTLIGAAHVRIRPETGANLLILVPAILVLSIGLDHGWKRTHHPGTPAQVQVGH